jgi:hypothetical protein
LALRARGYRNLALVLGCSAQLQNNIGRSRQEHEITTGLIERCQQKSRMGGSISFGYPESATTPTNNAAK